ncbi:MFS transporter [Nonomuraea sp. B5E05]|uniref:MFS transporter n=1 Tax=Nonomuraea sp. B5E05 TaxID=3153569 RepID=UPI0032608BD1
MTGVQRGLRRALIALCVTQITGWGVLYYAFPVMVSTVSADTGWSAAASMGAFSLGAVVSAVAGIVVGRLIDVRGPRQVMTAGSVVGVVSVLAIAAAPSLPAFYAAWALSGVAQAAVLYPPAFAALTSWYGPHRLRALTTLTLVGGLASTVFAPLTAYLLDFMSWRGVFLLLAVILGAVTIPLHALALTPPWPGASRVAHRQDPHPATVVRSRAFIMLTVAMSAAALGMFAATVNLVPLLTWRGMDTHLAAVALGLCGAGQLLGRLGYGALSARVESRPRTVGLLAAAAVSVLALGLLPGPTALLIVVSVLAGAIRGLFTLLQATAVADRWGTRAFGRINGVFTAPVTAATALAPGAGALLTEVMGGYVASYGVLAGLVLLGTLAAGMAGTGRLPAAGSDIERSCAS